MANSRLCSIHGCGKVHLAAGLCNAHYLRKRKYGDPLGGGNFRADMPLQCTVEGCERPHSAMGLCEMHYTRRSRTGEVELKGYVSLPLSWLEQHSSYDGVECLKWPFATASNGYGSVRYQGVNMTASRAMCTIKHGSAPDVTAEAAHSCGKGHFGCVHPDHLRWATPEQNASDKVDHGTWLHGEMVPHARLRECDVRKIRAYPPGIKSSVIAMEYGVSRQAVANARSGRTWSWLD